MIDVVRGPVRGVSERHRLTRVNHPRRSPNGARESPKVVIKRAVLLHDDHDMLDLAHPWRPVESLRSGRGMQNARSQAAAPRYDQETNREEGADDTRHGR